MEELENKIRRSSQQGKPDNFRHFLEYARLVRDQSQVYAFMEQNKIGINQPQFWIAKLNLYQNKCQYIQIINTLKLIRGNSQLKNHKYFHLIKQFEQMQIETLKKLFKKKLKQRRTPTQYYKLTFCNIQKETRKYGNIQIYVDPQNRHNFSLEDYIDFLINDDQIQIQFQVNKNIYLTKQSSKPLSFITKKTQLLFSVANQLVNLHRKSQRKSIGNSLRTSDVNKKFQTPDFKNKKKNNQNLDSVQILSKKPLRNSKRMMILPEKYNPQIEIKSQKQLTRSILGISVKSKTKKRNSQSFSFGKKQFSFSLLDQSIHQQQNDQAFIYEVINSSKKSQEQNQNLSEQLVKVIQQFQTHQSLTQGNITRTVSQIDSNQENNYFIEEKEIDFNYQEEYQVRMRNVLKSRHKQKKNRQQNYENFQKDEQFDIQRQYPQLFTPKMNQKTKIEKLSNKNMQSQNKNNRFLRISQEKSYSMSQSKSIFKY